jgi:hypothetical protein
MTKEERQSRLKGNTDALRGDDAADNEDWLDEPKEPITHEKPSDLQDVALEMDQEYEKGAVASSLEEEALASKGPEPIEVTIGDVKSALLALGFVDHSTQLEELVSRYGTGATFQNLTQEQKAEIVLRVEKEPDDNEPTDE